MTWYWNTYCTMHVDNTIQIIGCTRAWRPKAKQFGIDITVKTHKKSIRVIMEKIIIKLYLVIKIEKEGRLSKFNHEIIQTNRFSCRTICI